MEQKGDTEGEKRKTFTVTRSNTHTTKARLVEQGEALDDFVRKLLPEDRNRISESLQNMCSNIRDPNLDPYFLTLMMSLLDADSLKPPPSDKLTHYFIENPKRVSEGQEDEERSDLEADTQEPDDDSRRASGESCMIEPEEVLNYVVDRIPESQWRAAELSYMRSRSIVVVKEQHAATSQGDVKRTPYPDGALCLATYIEGKFRTIPLTDGPVNILTICNMLKDLGLAKGSIGTGEVAEALANFRTSFLVGEPKEIPNLVRVEPSGFSPRAFIAPSSRAQVIILAGESGGGKSRYIVDKLHSEDFLMLRYSLRKEVSFDTEPYKGGEREESEVDLLYRFLVLLKRRLHEMDHGRSTFYHALQRITWTLLDGRDSWAFEKLNGILERAVTKDMKKKESEDLTLWLQQAWNETAEPVKVEKLAIVLDECGKNLSLVSGLISGYRNKILPRYLRISKEVVLVLCGAGTELVRRTNNVHVFGSDPSLSRVVMVSGTNLANVPQNLQEAIQSSTYGAVLATNTRMLTKGLIPMMHNELVTLEAQGVDLYLRRKAFGSFRFAADYSIRKYKTLNGIESLQPCERSAVLRKAFSIMLRSALWNVYKTKDAESRRTVVGRLLEEHGVDVGGEEASCELPGDSDVFLVGLATRDPAKTSNALRYYACEGCAVPLYASDGASFELIVACQLERSYAVLGYLTGFLELRSAWPPAAEKNASLSEENVQKCVSRMGEDGREDVKEICRLLAEWMKTDQNGALILRQGVPNAQGGDVLVLVTSKTESVWRLGISSFQAKNWNKTRYKSAFNAAALSVGYDPATGDRTPVERSAGYSYQATMKLLSLVAANLDIGEIAFDRRVIVFAYCHKDRSKNDQDGLQGSVELWSREMLEPAISAFRLADDEDELDDVGTDDGTSSG